MLRERLGKLHFVADGDRHEPDVLPDVLPRRRGHGPPDRALPGVQRLARTEHPRDGRLVRDRASRCCVFIANVVVSLRHRRPAGDDPWGAQTLEWATSSPPPRHNFAALPPIRSYAPLLDLREAASSTSQTEHGGGWRGEARRDLAARLGGVARPAHRVQAVFAPKAIQFAIPAVASAACIAAGLVLWAPTARHAERRALAADHRQLVRDRDTDGRAWRSRCSARASGCG